MKNKLKYKKNTFIGKLNQGIISLRNFFNRDVVIVKAPITKQGFTYLNRHLLKINRVFKNILVITINTTEQDGETVYTAILSLVVNR